MWYDTMALPLAGHSVVYVAIAACLGMQGRDKMQRATPPVPEQTVDTVKEDVEWAKTRARSAPR